MTILKKNLCDISGNVIIEDIVDGDILPESAKIDIMADMNGPYYVMEGYVWIEEHYTTKWSWLITLLFFWCITPQKNKIMSMYLKDKTGMCLELQFPLDITKTLKENIQSLPENKKYGIKDIWIITDSIIN